MKNKILKLAGHSFVYAVGNTLGAVGGFILIPLYTHILSTAEYGVLELLNRTADILMLFMLMGVRQAFIRFYFDRDEAEWHKTVVCTTLVLILTSAVIVSLIFFPFRNLIADVLFSESATGALFVFVLIWVILNLLVRVGMTHLQIQMKSVKYVTISFISFILFITSNIILVYIYRKGIIGILITNIWVSALIGFTFLFFLIKWARFKFSFGLAKDLLRFGLPFLPTTAFGFLLMNSDRYILGVFSSLDDVGIYSLAYKIGFLGLGLIMGSFEKVWSPFLFENYDKSEGPSLIGKAFTYYTMISITAGLLISVMAPIVIPLISHKSFHGSSKLISLICLGSIFYSMASLADAGVLISKKTGYKPLIFGLSSFIAIALNLVLVPRYGSSGAALAISFSFLALFLINLYVSNKFYTILIDHKKLFLIFASATSAYLFSAYLFGLADDLKYMKICSALSFLIYPCILWAGGFLSDEEKGFVKGLFSKLRLRTTGAASGA